MILHERGPFSRLAATSLFGTLFSRGLRRGLLFWWIGFFLRERVALQFALPVLAQGLKVNGLARHVQRDLLHRQMRRLDLLVRRCGKLFRQSNVIEGAVPRYGLGIHNDEFPGAARQVVSIPEPGVVGKPVRLDLRFEDLVCGQLAEVIRPLVIGSRPLGSNNQGSGKEHHQDKRLQPLVHVAHGLASGKSGCFRNQTLPVECIVGAKPHDDRDVGQIQLVLFIARCLGSKLKWIRYWAFFASLLLGRFFGNCGWRAFLLAHPLISMKETCLRERSGSPISVGSSCPPFPQQENHDDVVPWNRSTCTADHDFATR